MYSGQVPAHMYMMKRLRNAVKNRQPLVYMNNQSYL